MGSDSSASSPGSPDGGGRQRTNRAISGARSDVDGDNRRQRSNAAAARRDCDVDGRIAAIAGAQRGIITRRQLLEAGLTVAAVDHWLRRGRLRLRQRGVYALGPELEVEFAEEAAAVLAYGESCLLSHGSAACLWGFHPAKVARPIHVTVVGAGARRRPGVCVHRAASLLERDRCRHGGIAVVSPPRALLELAGELEDRDLELALDLAIRRGRLTIFDVRGVLSRYPHRAGGGRLRELAVPGRRSSLTWSGGEEALLSLVRRAGLPEPEVNFKLGPWTVDFYWPRERLVVELDGHDYHASRWALERDHRKDLYLRDRRLEVLRFVGRQVKRQPEAVLVRIAQELARGR